MKLWSFLLPRHPVYRSARVAAPSKAEACVWLEGALDHPIVLAHCLGNAEANAICTFAGAVDLGAGVLELLPRGAHEAH